MAYWINFTVDDSKIIQKGRNPVMASFQGLAFAGFSFCSSMCIEVFSNTRNHLTTPSL